MYTQHNNRRGWLCWKCIIINQSTINKKTTTITKRFAIFCLWLWIKLYLTRSCAKRFIVGALKWLRLAWGCWCMSEWLFGHNNMTMAVSTAKPTEENDIWLTCSEGTIIINIITIFISTVNCCQNHELIYEIGLYMIILWNYNRIDLCGRGLHTFKIQWIFSLLRVPKWEQIGCLMLKSV